MSLLLMFALAQRVLAQAGPAPVSSTALDLKDYRTTEKALAASLSGVKPRASAVPGYLGIHVTADAAGPLTIDQVQAGSPAAGAGLRPGDIVRRVDGSRVKTAAALREQLQGREPGAAVVLDIERAGKAQEIRVQVAATSRPLSAEAARLKAGSALAFLGVQVAAPPEGSGVRVEQITPASPAAAAGLAVGDLILEIDGKPTPPADQFRAALTARKPGETVLLAVQRAGKGLELKATLAPNKAGAAKGGGPPVPDILPLWKKDLYRLGVVLIEFPDVKHNDKITPAHWEEALFSWGTYRTSATGQPAFGSLNDYFHEQSYGKFRIEGVVFAPVLVARKRADYAPGSGTANKTALLVEVLDKLVTRAGKNALDGLDGLCFLYAGGRVSANRGSLYAPHCGSMNHQGKRWPYMLAPEGGDKMETISVLAPELGKLLGLPELFARPENAGSEGLGVWCLMSDGAGATGRPAHLSAWCKEQLGWLDPVVITPYTPQKLILSPVQRSRRECYKVLIRPDGSEYLLLENRTARGFDAELPAQGLLIWRVVNGEPTLEEAHGIAGPTGPRVLLDAVPYPSLHNNAFTPYTTPSSRSRTGGGWPVFITNIRRLSDGRVIFQIGYEYY
jgi:M6 family metalloprotease-like protein